MESWSLTGSYPTLCSRHCPLLTYDIPSWSSLKSCFKSFSSHFISLSHVEPPSSHSSPSLYSSWQTHPSGSSSFAKEPRLTMLPSVFIHNNLSASLSRKHVILRVPVSGSSPLCLVNTFLGRVFWKMALCYACAISVNCTKQKHKLPAFCRHI